jgi:cytoskeletal protein CcmA (bactofilin family)
MADQKQNAQGLQAKGGVSTGGGSLAAAEVKAPTPTRATVVEEGTQFKGALSSSCPIVVRGQVQGELSAPSLTVSPSGSVHGTVKVSEIRSQGELAGEFDADVVELSGVVKDNTIIRARALEVKLGVSNGKMQLVFGETVLEVGDAPALAATASSTSTESSGTSGNGAAASAASNTADAAASAAASATAEPASRRGDEGERGSGKRSRRGGGGGAEETTAEAAVPAEDSARTASSSGDEPSY